MLLVSEVFTDSHGECSSRYCRSCCDDVVGGGKNNPDCFYASQFLVVYDTIRNEGESFVPQLRVSLQPAAARKKLSKRKSQNDKPDKSEKPTDHF